MEQSPNNNLKAKDMKKLIAGNWKMNGSKADAISLAQELVALVKNDLDILQRADLLVCPPFLHIESVQKAIGSSELSTGAQDCAQTSNGAYTGDISAAMINDIGCEYVILGHSERRTNHQESDSIVSQKAKTAHEHDLITIICVGETAEERDQGKENDVIGGQLDGSIPDTATTNNIVIAYEPVWAIGSGKTASPEDVANMHAFIRAKLENRFTDGNTVRILYGGSMKPENAKALLSTPNVDGGLIGGASLKADQFIAIAKEA